MAYTQRQIMVCLAYLAYTDQWLPAPPDYDAALFADLTKALSPQAAVPLPAVAGQWSVVWGPASYTTPGAYLPDNMMYVAKLNGQTAPAQYAVAVRGTDGRVMLDWLMEDFDIAQMIPWNGSQSAFIRGDQHRPHQPARPDEQRHVAAAVPPGRDGERGDGDGQRVLHRAQPGIGAERDPGLRHARRASAVGPDRQGHRHDDQLRRTDAGDAGFAAAFAAAFGYAGTSPLPFWSSPPGSSAPSYADCVRNTLDVAPLVWNVTTMHTIAKLYEGHFLDSIDPPYGSLVFGDIVSHVANAFAANDFTQLQAAQTPLAGTFVKKSDLPPNGPRNPWIGEAEYQHHMSYPILLGVPELNQLDFSPPATMTLPSRSPSSSRATCWRCCLIYPQHGFAGDRALRQAGERLAELRPRAAPRDLRVEPVRRHQARQVAEILGQRFARQHRAAQGEAAQELGRPDRGVRREGRRPARGRADRDQCAARAQVLPRLQQRLAADVLEHAEHRRGERVQARHDFARAERLQFRALGVGRRQGDRLGAGQRGELQREAPDAAGRAGDQHAPPEHPAEHAQRLQRRAARDRQRAGALGVERVGKRGRVGAGHRAPLGPRAAVALGDDARADRRPAAVRGGGHDAPGGIPAGNRAGREHPALRQLAVVERERLDGDEHLVGRGTRLGDLLQAVTGRSPESTTYAFMTAPSTAGSPAAVPLRGERSDSSAMGAAAIRLRSGLERRVEPAARSGPVRAAVIALVTSPVGV